MDGTNWHITVMEEFKEVTKDGVVYAKLVDGSKYEKQVLLLWGIHVEN